MSDKSIAQKLLIKDGYAVAFVNAPKDYKKHLGELPKGVKVVGKPAKDLDLIQVFVPDRKALESQLHKLKPFVKSTTLLWVSYLKGTSKTKTDINRDTLHAYARTIGLEGISLISVDDDWSAMRFKLV